MFCLYIDRVSLNEGDPRYNELGINTWKNILQVPLHEPERFWNALKGFLQIEICSILELQQLLKIKSKREEAI